MEVQETKNYKDMMEIKFSICDEVVYFNTANGKFEKAEVSAVRIIPTGISKDEQGKNRLDGYVVLYETADRGPVLTEAECFASEDECREHYRCVFFE